MATVDTNDRPEFDPVAPEVHDWGHFSTGIGPGLLAGLIMAIVLMVLSAARGYSVVHPAQVVASVFLGKKALAGGAGIIVLGTLIHFLLSAILGGIFTAIFGRSTMQRALGFGLFYGIFLWAIAQFLLLPLTTPYAAQLGTVWTFFLAHVSYGLMLAASVPTVRDIDAPERGYIDPTRREVHP